MSPVFNAFIYLPQQLPDPHAEHHLAQDGNEQTGDIGQGQTQLHITLQQRRARLFVHIRHRHRQYPGVQLRLAHIHVEEKPRQADGNRHRLQALHGITRIEPQEEIQAFGLIQIALEKLTIRRHLQLGGQVTLEILQRVVFEPRSFRLAGHVHHAMPSRQAACGPAGEHQHAPDAGLIHIQPLPGQRLPIHQHMLDRRSIAIASEYLGQQLTCVFAHMPFAQGHVQIQAHVTQLEFTNVPRHRVVQVGTRYLGGCRQIKHLTQMALVGAAHIQLTAVAHKFKGAEGVDLQAGGCTANQCTHRQAIGLRTCGAEVLHGGLQQGVLDHSNGHHHWPDQVGVEVRHFAVWQFQHIVLHIQRVPLGQQKGFETLHAKLIERFQGRQPRTDAVLQRPSEYMAAPNVHECFGFGLYHPAGQGFEERLGNIQVLGHLK